MFFDGTAYAYETRIMQVYVCVCVNVLNGSIFIFDLLTGRTSLRIYGVQQRESSFFISYIPFMIFFAESKNTTKLNRVIGSEPSETLTRFEITKQPVRKQENVTERA